MKPRVTITNPTREQHQMLVLLAGQAGWMPSLTATQDQLDTLKTLHRARLVDESHEKPPSHRITREGRRLLGPGYEAPLPDTDVTEPEGATA